MALVDLKFAQLHNPIFLAGKNFAPKLDPTQLAGLELFYDREQKELHVHYNDVIGIIPSTNVACMVEGIPEKKAVHQLHPIVAGRLTAQVETPQSHVHAGEGHGKTGKSK